MVQQEGRVTAPDGAQREPVQDKGLGHWHSTSELRLSLLISRSARMPLAVFARTMSTASVPRVIKARTS
jgi:hypothetical protein